MSRIPKSIIDGMLETAEERRARYEGKRAILAQYAKLEAARASVCLQRAWRAHRSGYVKAVERHSAVARSAMDQAFYWVGQIRRLDAKQ